MKCPHCQSDIGDDSKFCKECGTNISSDGERQPSFTKTLETPVEVLTRGSLFADRYEIIEELGRGGMGAVYRVEDTKAKEEIALKLIKPEIAADKKTIERFRQELTTARKIRHKNICGMYDLNEDKGTYYITMEYVSGEDLKSFLKRSGHLTVSKAVSIAKQVCDGLSEAHGLGIVHRDLKPGNIMIDKQGSVRIMDFGIARTLNAKGITGNGVMIGTPEYMSPEQAEAKDIDYRSDIYSVGVILYEMVTGRQPFEGDTPLSIAMKHKGERPDDPKKYNAQIPDDLNRLILRCLEKDEQARYQTAEKLMADLISIENATPTTERDFTKKKTLTSKEITVTFAAKKLLIPAILIVALVLIGLFFWHPWTQQQGPSGPSDKPSVAVLYFENNSGNAEYDNWRDALSTMLITDLQQSKYIEVAGVERIYGALDKFGLLDAEKYSTDDIKKVAAEVGASHVVFGSYVTPGNKFIIHASLLDASNPEVVVPLKIEGIGEEGITDSVDYLTREIKMGLNFSQGKIADDIDESIGKITTNSPEAYRFYLDSMKLFNEGKPRQSLEALEKAIALDPEFAIAYRYAAAYSSVLGNSEKMMEYAGKAFELSKGDRVSERERLNIQGMYYEYGAGPSTSGTKESRAEAFRLYRKLVDLYPLDFLGNDRLGGLYEAQGNWEEAVKHYRINVQNNVSSFVPYYNCGVMLRSLGEYDESIEVFEKYIANFSDNVYLRRAIAETLLAQGKYDSALAEVDKAFILDPLDSGNHVLKGDILYLKGDFLEAEKEYDKDSRRDRKDVLYMAQGRFAEAKETIENNIILARESGNKRLEGMQRIKLGYLYAEVYQDADKAIREYEQASHIASELQSCSYVVATAAEKGLVHVITGSLREAENTAEELNTLIVECAEKLNFNERSMSAYYHLMGRIVLKKRNFDEAIDYFNKALALEPHGRQQSVQYIRSLAMAYHESDELEKAEEEYLRVTHLTTGRLDCNDTYAKSFYELGKIYEQQGDTGKAVDHYEKFLDLWKNADPGIAAVEDAKKRLAGLKN